jgi:hypothetical protein
VDPDAAEGAQLQKVSAITGTIAEGPTKSTVALILNLAPGGAVVAGVSKARVTNSDPPIVFVLNESIENLGGVNIFPATSATAENAGPVAANAGTITTIHTPTAGWVAVSNPSDAVIGALAESDPALRVRRNAELRSQGAATPAATQAAFLAYRNALGETPVISARFYENTTSLAHPMGVLPYSFLVVVWDGPSAPIPSADLDAILAANRDGGTPGAWVRPTQRSVDVRVTLTRNPATYGGDAAVQAAVAARYDLRLEPGGTVHFAEASAAALALAGVLSVPTVELKFSADPTWLVHTPLTVSGLEIGTVDVNDVEVVIL